MRRIALPLLALLPLLAAAEEVTLVVDHGDPADRVDLVVLGDGYTLAEQGRFADDVDRIVRGIFDEAPFDAYRTYFNVRRIGVVSEESGADHPERGEWRVTALGSTYDCAGLERLLCVEVGAVYDVLGRNVAPHEQDVILVLVNDPVYGGSGGAIGVASTHPAAIELVLHELGHSFAGLADEYEYGTCAGERPEPAAANVTAATAREAIKWNRGGGPPEGWIEPHVPLPTGWPGSTGLYEGGQYCAEGYYRPTWNSKMRNLGRPFDAVNEEQLVRRIYNWVSPAGATLPVTRQLSTAPGEPLAFSVAPPRPEPDTMRIRWHVDGEPAGDGLELELDTAARPPGIYTVVAEVEDATARVRADPWGVLRETAIWTVSIEVPGGSAELAASLAVEPAASRPGAPLALRATVDNRGTATSAEAMLTVFRSADGTRSAHDLAVATSAVAPVLPGRALAVDATAAAPGTPGAGYYYPCVVAADSIASGDGLAAGDGVAAGDGFASCGTPVEVIVGTPRLGLVDIAAGSAHRNVGEPIPYAAAVRNEGSLALAGGEAFLYVLRTGDPGGWRLLNRWGIPALAPAAAVSVGHLVTLWEPGSHVFAVCLFEDPELHLGWQCHLSTTVEVFDGPDLLATLGLSADPLAVGAPFEATAHLENRGGAPSAPTPLRLRAGLGTDPTAADPELGPAVGAPALEAGGATTLAFSGHAPPVPGLYRFAACADAVEGDANPANDCSAAHPVTVVEAVTLAEALDNHRLEFSTSGTTAWFGQTAIEGGDGDAAQSAPPGDGGVVTLATTVDGPGRLSFRWRVDSEPDHDALQVAVDGVQVHGASGQSAFERRAVRINGPGDHGVTWQYGKDAAGAAGADAAWVDRVLWQPGTRSVARDFDGDGDSDALLRHVDGRWRIFELDRGERVSDSSPRLFGDPDWQLAASADFDDDGDSDVLLANPVTGAWRLFTMEGLGVVASHWLPLPPATEWRIAAAVDGDADGDADLVLVNRAERNDYRFVPFASGQPLEAHRPPIWSAPDWHPVTAADIDGDGAAELLLQHAETGRWRAFGLDPLQSEKSCSLTLFRGPQWTLAGAGDFDGDGDADPLLRHADGWWRLFPLDDGETAPTELPGAPGDPEWQLVAADGDLDGDGDADLVMRHVTTGAWRWLEMQDGAVRAHRPLELWRDLTWGWQ